MGDILTEITERFSKMALLLILVRHVIKMTLKTLCEAEQNKPDTQ